MSMTLDIGDDRDEDLDDTERDDDDLDEEDGGDRSSRSSSRRRPQRKDTDDDTDTDDGDDDDLDGLSEDDLRAELKRARKRLATAGKQTARQRTARKALEKRIAAIEGDLDDDTDDDEPDDDEDGDGKSKPKTTAKSLQKTVNQAVKRRERELAEEHRRDLIDTRAEAALARAGVSERNLRLLKKELDYDEIDFDPRTRSIDGLEDEIDRLKDEFPDLFRRPRSGRRINGGDDRDRVGKRKKPMTATEIQAAQLRGGR